MQMSDVANTFEDWWTGFQDNLLEHGESFAQILEDWKLKIDSHKTRTIGPMLIELQQKWKSNWVALSNVKFDFGDIAKIASSSVTKRALHIVEGLKENMSMHNTNIVQPTMSFLTQRWNQN